MKTKIRKKALRSRKILSPSAIMSKSGAIGRRLFARPEFKNARTVMFYVSQGSEVHTHRMIRDAIRTGKTVAVPVVVEKGKKLIPVIIRDFDLELSPGTRGILEPSLNKNRVISPGEIDLVILPGVAFDPGGNRVGRGHAYYDGFLKQFHSSIPRIGLAFERQVLGEVPRAAHDVPVTQIITEKRTIECATNFKSGE